MSTSISQNVFYFTVYGPCNYLWWQISKQLLLLYLAACKVPRQGLQNQAQKIQSNTLPDLPSTSIWTLWRNVAGSSSSLLPPVWWYKEHRSCSWKNQHSNPFLLTRYVTSWLGHLLWLAHMWTAISLKEGMMFVFISISSEVSAIIAPTWCIIYEEWMHILQHFWTWAFSSVQHDDISCS